MSNRPLNKTELPGWVSGMLSPLSGMYGRVVAGRNRRFDAGEGVVNLKEPVISVGNLTVGGTGKTPVCQYLVSFLRDAGRAPAIAMRGYGASSDGVSDEALEYSSMFEDLPLAVGFGISNAAQVQGVHQWADAAIVGSALVRELAKAEDPVKRAGQFITEIS